jgi:acylphosphatase
MARRRVCASRATVAAGFDVSEELQAKRFLVSGMVQGVGYRFFAVREAGRLGLAGYAKNLRDGRVEVYAIGRTDQLSELRAQLERGPRAASVSSVTEEDAPVLPRYSVNFSVEFDSW